MYKKKLYSNVVFNRSTNVSLFSSLGNKILDVVGPTCLVSLTGLSVRRLRFNRRLQSRNSIIGSHNAELIYILRLKPSKGYKLSLIHFNNEKIREATCKWWKYFDKMKRILVTMLLDWTSS